MIYHRIKIDMTHKDNNYSYPINTSQRIYPLCMVLVKKKSDRMITRKKSSEAVAKNVEDNTVVGGNPAKLICSTEEFIRRRKSKELRQWSWNDEIDKMTEFYWHSEL